MKIVIVGGVAGGATAAARLRRLDEQAEIVIFERGEYVSFANCGLPYYIGGEITDREDLTLQTPQSFRRRFNIDVRVLNEVIAIHPEKKTVDVKKTDSGEVYSEPYDKLILSPGAEPVKPAVRGMDSSRVFTLRNIPDTLRIKDFIDEKHPQTAVIAGGGYIGVEMAENLKNAGLDVTIVELADHLIAPLDFDMASEVQRYLKKRGINPVTGFAVESATDTEDMLQIRIKGAKLSAADERECDLPAATPEMSERENNLSAATPKMSERENHLSAAALKMSERKNSSSAANAQECELTADMLIMSVGVRPESGLAKACGIALGIRGCILVNSHMETSIPDIYAVGDAVQVTDFITKEPAFIPLAGPANKQGRIAADNICKIGSEYTGTQGSAVLKIFDMTVATTGLNEKTAAGAGIDYDKVYLYSGSHASYYPRATNMSIKALWDKSNEKLIGAQIVGFDGVDKRLDVLAAAIRFGARITDLTKLELCYAPPFGSAKDPVNMVGFVADNVISGRVKQFFWHDVAALPRDGSVTLLDVRTQTEVKRGKIDGFVNIPVDTIRENLSLIPKDKPVYVHCHSGLRSYIACQILSGNGYDCYNLAGGFRLYESVMKERSASGLYL